eukprot:CAMPEP_0184541872 /NCGR_PEP_ID=MMETSP0199_2-20130426/1649_1 /TAXON_ID=1112570 /ORGANISM="Thraustochytrium sp., Strain LLF1b" /LENGTH=581 /DNA_ID=CAMNT_0026935623 /DNA_START=139 /DNA_END=1881 /DNA_ORIENTATION=+
MWPFSSGGADADQASTDKAVESAESQAESIFKDDPKDESDKPERGNLPGFDAKALERAAAAAKELEGLKFAAEAVSIAKLKEERRSKQAIAKAEENKVRQAAMEVERTRAQEAERRQTLQQDHKMKQEQAYHADQLARKRHDDQLNAQRVMRDQQLKREEEFQLKVEGMKRQTAEYEAKLRKDTERARVQAEMEGKADIERKNWDLHMQRFKMEQAEMRSTILQSVKEAGAIVGSGLNNFLEDRQKLATTAGLFTALAVGLYGARVSTGVIGRFVEARMGKPPLVRETSRTVPFSPASFRKFFTSSKDALEGVVVNSKLRERLQNLAVSTQNTKKNRAPFRNALLYGPPGTGKTLYARQLAQASNCDFAILTGGDIAPLGRDAVTEIHKLFSWAKTSRKGLVVFVDEADAFLRSRADAQMSEDQRNALNTWLAMTGSESTAFQVVYATNLPTDLDPAIVDRTDEVIKFQLPDEEERKAMINLYWKKYVLDAHQNVGGTFGGPVPIKTDDIDEAALEKIATRTQGFSGREIAKLAIGWQAAAYASPNALLTKPMFDQVVDDRVEAHITKLEWEAKIATRTQG